MIIWENIILALTGLLSNKMRSILTMLGIIIGIGSVIAIMTVGESLTGYVSSTMQSFGANNITIMLEDRKEEEDTSDTGMNFGISYSTTNPTEEDLFTKEMVDDFCNTFSDSIYAISAYEYLSQTGTDTATYGKDTANVYAVGVSAGFFVSNDVTEVIAGSMFTENDYNSRKKVAMVSDKLVNKLFNGNTDEAIGKMIEVKADDKYENYTILGVYKYEDAASAMGMSFYSEDNVVTNMYIPLKTVMNENHSTGYATFDIVTKAGVDSNAFCEQIERFFEAYYRNNENFQVTAFNMESMVSTMTDMMSTITVAISIIGGIALLVGGIGVMNIMLVSITERTREIGTRKALGATNSSIRIQFIVEAVILCLVGGVIGVIVGLLLGSLATSVLLQTPAQPSISSIVISLCFSMAIGVFFGYYPANKAAKMNPIDALRYD